MNGHAPFYAVEGKLLGYTQADIEWYEKQARISSGSEQAHWLKEAQWARDHINGYADMAEFNGGTYGNATGDYIDDSTPGKFFINDRAYHLRAAQENEEWAEWHHKRANDAIARGDLSSAHDHEARAASYERACKEHLATAQQCTRIIGDEAMPSEPESTLKGYTQDEIKRKMAKAQKDEGYWKSDESYHISMSKHAIDNAGREAQLREARIAAGKAAAAHDEYNKWRFTKPDK